MPIKKQPENIGESPQQKRVKFKLSITGIDIEIIGYQSDEFEKITKAFSSKLMWFFIAILLAFVISKIPDMIGAVYAFIDTS